MSRLQLRSVYRQLLRAADAMPFDLTASSESLGPTIKRAVKQRFRQSAVNPASALQLAQRELVALRQIGGNRVSDAVRGTQTVTYDPKDWSRMVELVRQRK
ncbi:putative mitochondrial protein [Andalucia godoyi]|uniref:Putative mitochondrial protein n=1 Tax=Andalucia godoyi TaxID=505711 RepID=A0A8K0AG43_ANDGO|nr:putative mitochondrial protein [Andalucia godoyi]|eukprot:ANDGO_07802.mRNA.1 putative mitochondrial protein